MIMDIDGKNIFAGGDYGSVILNNGISWEFVHAQMRSGGNFSGFWGDSKALWATATDGSILLYKDGAFENAKAINENGMPI